jgi:hypothetical protein
MICFGQTTLAQSQLRNHDFQVVVPAPERDKATLRIIRGDERKNNAQNRLSIISESQYDYPEPESGCGPIALLNTLIWYEKYGLIEPLFRDAEPESQKERLFAEIDRRLLQHSGVTRTELKGSRNMDIAVVLDTIVEEQSKGSLRIHTDYYEAPLRLQDLLQTMPNFRSGYLLGYPKHPQTGEMLTLHAMTLIRADRAGYVTLATWGEKYRGLLRMRGGEQWFIPQSPQQAEVKIEGMQRFIPFAPIAGADR